MKELNRKAMLVAYALQKKCPSKIISVRRMPMGKTGKLVFEYTIGGSDKVQTSCAFGQSHFDLPLPTFATIVHRELAGGNSKSHAGNKGKKV